MLVKCTPSAHRRGCNCLPNKQTANYQTARLRLSQPTLFDRMKHFLFGKIPLLILLFFSVQSVSFGQCPNDTEAPDAICFAGPLNISLDGNGDVQIVPAQLNNGSTDNCGIASLSVSPNTFNCDDIVTSPHTIMLTVMDAAGNSNFCTVDINIADNVTPLIACPDDTNVACGASDDPIATGRPTGSDNCDLADTNPMGFTGPFNTFFYYRDTPMASSTIGECNTVSRIWRAEDIYGNVDSCEQILTFVDNANPTLDFSGEPNANLLDTTIDCDDNIPAYPAVTASDNCGMPIITMDSIVTKGGNPAMCDFYEYTITRNFTATDDCGRTVTDSYVITVEDNDAPDFMGQPTTLNESSGGACSTFVNLELMGVMDACAGSNITTSYEIVTMNGSVVDTGNGLDASGTYDVGVYDFIFTVTDPCGNTAKHTVVVNIEDNVAPTAACKTSIEVSINSSGVGIINPSSVDNGSTDNCTLPEDLILSVSPDTLTCDSIAASPIMGTLIVMDASGNTNSCSTSISVVDNSDPAAFCQDITATLIGDTISVYAIEIDGGSNDACANPLELQISRDGGITFQDSVMFQCANAGDNDVILQVDDNNGQTSTCMAVVTVVDTVAPVAMCNPITVTLNDNGMYSLMAMDSTDIVMGTTDNCSFTTTFSKSMFTCDDIDIDGLIANANEGDTIQVIYTDLSMNTDTCMTVITVEDNTAPMLSCVDITVGLNSDGVVSVFPTDLLAGDIYLSSGNNESGTAGTSDFGVNITTPVEISFDWDFTTADANGADTLGYVINGEFMPIAFSTGTSTGTIAPFQLFGSDVFSFQMKTTDNQGGVAEAWISNLSATLNDDFAMANWSLDNTNSDGKAFFVDACTPITYEIYDDMLNIWADSVVLDCTPLMDTFSIRAIDENGNVTITAAPCTVTVDDNQAPIASCDEVVTGVDGGGNVTIMAAEFDQGSIDACGGALSFRVSDNDGLSFANTLMYDCSDVDTTYAIILEVSDASMNLSFCVTEVSIQDNAAPVVTCPSDVTVDCSMGTDVSVTGTATATDNCGDGTGPSSVTVTMSPDTFTPTNGNANCRQINRRFTATDANGNTGLCFQTITVEDNDDPVFDLATIPMDTTVNCGANVVPAPTATDNCDNMVAITLDIVDSRFNYAVTPAVNTESPTNDDFYNYSITRTWTATDNCGNIDVITQVVMVQDITGPVFDYPMTLAPISNDAGSCSAFVELDLEDFISDCAKYQFLTISNDAGFGYGDGEADASGTFDVGTHTVEFTATDPSNNTTVYPVTFTVFDGQSPNAACKPNGATISLSSGGTAPITVSMVDNGSTDNCGLASTSISQSSVACVDVANSPITVTLTATDNVGNINTCTTTFNVVENSPPTILCPSNVTVNCDDSLDPDMNAALGEPTVSTTCMNMIQPTRDDQTIVGGSTPNCRTIERTWTATNSSGSASCVQNIVVQDTVAPILSMIRVDTTVNCNAIPDPMVVTATDNCAMPPAVNFVATDDQNPDETQCGHYDYEIIRKWTAVDNCGNMDVDSVIITVIDTLAPVFSFPMPLIIGNDPDECFATVNVNLGDYITDCAAFQFLDIENNAQIYGNGNGTDNINGQYAIGEYPIEVIAEDPCGNADTIVFTLSIRDTETPNAACDTDDILVLDNNGNGLITPADIDEGSSDNCGNVTLSLSQTMFTSADVGNVNLVLTVTDDAGNTSSCNTQLTIIDRPRVTIGNVSGQMGTIVSVPVLVENFEDICGIQATFTVDDDMIAEVTGVSNFNLDGLLAGDFSITGNTVTLSWIDPDASGETLDGISIFTIDVELVGNNGDVSTISIDNDPNEFVIGRCFNGSIIGLASTGIDGSVTVTANPMAFAISGRLATPVNNNIALANVVMTGSAAGADVTNNTGLYSLPVDGGNTVTITPAKDISPKNGVDPVDVLTIKAHDLNFAELTDPHQLIAADVNNDKTVNVLDRFLVQAIVLNNIVAFPDVPSWKFVEADYVFSIDPLNDPYPQSVDFMNINANQTDVDFIGVKMGDLTNSADPLASIGTTGSNIFTHVNDRGGDLFFQMENQTLQAGTTIEVPFKAKDFINQMAYQFTLEFDPTMLAYQSVTPGALPDLSAEYFGWNDLAAGLLPAIWYELTPTTVADDEVLFTLTFEVLADAENLSDLLAIVDAPTEAAAFDENLTASGIDLTFDNATNTTGLATEIPILLANQPNPFSAETRISFSLPRAAQASLRVTDVSGKVLKTVEGFYNTGLQTIILEGNDFPAAGIYFYQLQTEWGALTQKMIVKK